MPCPHIFCTQQQGRIRGGSCNIQDGMLCDNSKRLEDVNQYHKALHLGCCSSPQPLTIITKCSMLDVAAVLDPPLSRFELRWKFSQNDT